jgi:hypothetical protein
MVIKRIGSKFVTTLIILLFMVSALSAISVNAEDPNMVVKGAVYDAETEKPIMNAIVFLWNEKSEFKTETGEDGTFVIEVPHAPYKLKVEAKGYHPVDEHIEKTEHTEVSFTFSLKPIEAKPDPMIAFGHVYNGADEKPIRGAVVYFFGENHDFKALTGELGGFEVKLPPGHYTVEVMAEGFYPWVEEISGESNDEVKLRVMLRPQSENNEEPRGIHVKGKLFVADTDKPIPDARVLLKGENGHSADAVTNDDGYFEMKVTEGLYYVHAWAKGFKDLEEKVEIFNVEEFYLELFAEPLPDDEKSDKPSKEEYFKPRLSGQVFNANTNKPIRAEVILEPEFVMPKMHYMVLGMRWGMLECDKDAPEIAKWDGFVQVTDGFVKLIRTVGWDGEDKIFDQTNRLTLEWNSKTRPCWDGLVILIVVPMETDPAPHITIHTEKWSKVIEFKDLVVVHRIISVDDLGNELEIRTKLMEMPDRERPDRPKYTDENPERHPERSDRPPSDENPDMPPDEPQERPESDRPPKDEEPRTRAETDEMPLELGLDVPEDKMMEVRESVMNHYRERCRPIVTETNDKGYYAFKELPSGHYRMWARSHGFIEYYNEFNIKPKDHLLTDVYLRPMEREERERDRDVDSERDRDPEPDKERCFQVVKGMVLDARTGDPVANAKVTFERIIIEKDKEDYVKTDSNGKRGGEKEKAEIVDYQSRTDKPLKESDKDSMKIFSTMTNERGYFEIKLPCGMYKMAVYARGYEQHFDKLAVKDETPEMLKIQLKKSAADPNTTDMPALSDNKNSDGVDTKSLGVQLFEDDSLNRGVQGLLVALLIMGILLPLFLVIRHRRSKKPVSRPKRTLKKPAAAASGPARRTASKDLKNTHNRRVHHRYTRPIRDF